MAAPFEAFFLPAADSGKGQRLCLFHAPRRSPVLGAIVHLHAFAEEMNKARRMVALTARSLAESGYAVLQIDLYGCGDSSGEFADATWQDWLDDAALAVAWLRQRSAAPLWLWGLRAGALLAAQGAAQQWAPSPCHLLLWQPPSAGRVLLQQFLRLRTARGMLAGSGERTGIETLKRELADGKHVEIAGYALSPALATGLEAATLAPPALAARAVCIEIDSRGELSPALQTAVRLWLAAGWQVDARAIPGAPFWQTTEIETVPALVDSTLQALLAPEAVAA